MARAFRQMPGIAWVCWQVHCKATDVQCSRLQAATQTIIRVEMLQKSLGVATPAAVQTALQCRPIHPTC